MTEAYRRLLEDAGKAEEMFDQYELEEHANKLRLWEKDDA